MDYGVVLTDDTGEVSLESGNSPRLVKGLDSLFQTVVMGLLSDIESGGSGFAKALREAVPGRSDAAGIVSQRVRLCEENILYAQQDAAVPIDEQLQSLLLLSVTESGNGWNAEIQLINRSGDQITRVFS